MAAIETSVRATVALDDLYRRHVGDVYRYSYAVLGNHADAEDVTQTTFVNALRALERGEEPRNASNWLLVIAHNIVRQRWRQAASRPTEVELVHDVPDTPEEDDVELDELVRALQRIPPSQREALVMRELEGRSYQEISELLGLTTSALETLLFRARRSLAEELENLVTCQNAELAISQRLDKRLSRKESRRLDEHLAECDACTRLAATQARQRRAFKGLAVLPLPVGLMLFKDAPTAAAASLPTIGTASSAATTSVGGAGGAATGGVAAGGSLVGAAAVKVAAVLVAGVLVAGAAFEGAKLVLGDDGVPSTAIQEKAVKGAFAQRDLAAAPSAASTASAAPSQTTASAANAGLVGAAGAVAPPYRVTGAEDETDTGTSAEAPAPGSDTPASTPSDGGPTADGPSDPAPQPDQPVVPPADTPASEPPTTPTPITPVAPTATKPTKAKPTKGKKPTPTAKKPLPPRAKSPGKGKAASPGATKSETKPDSTAKPSETPKSNGPDAKSEPSEPGTSAEPSSPTAPAEAPVETPADDAAKHDHGADNAAAKK